MNKKLIVLAISKDFETVKQAQKFAQMELSKSCSYSPMILKMSEISFCVCRLIISDGDRQRLYAILRSRKKTHEYGKTSHVKYVDLDEHDLFYYTGLGNTKMVRVTSDLYEKFADEVSESIDFELLLDALDARKGQDE